MTIRTQLQAGGRKMFHLNETLRVQTTLKGGGASLNHNEGLKVRTALKAGAISYIVVRYPR
jgi:hypothetical protein